MTYSVQVTNNSGASQYIAIFLANALGGNAFSLVWRVRGTNNGGSVSFDWDQTAVSLGWGNTSQPLDVNVLYTSGQPAVAVYPSNIGGLNVLPVQYNNYGFFSGTPYAKSGIYNQAEIITDSSFTVSDATNMSVALYMSEFPALALRGAPNTLYYFDMTQLSYYLTVTDFAQGVALPQMNDPLGSRRLATSGTSMSTPVKIAFDQANTELKYTLNSNLNFVKV
ncbi:hypothetical protein [Pantoea sp. At-9b]|uniref:hypothetical protein n=1 Tax=Pantoea sp. (strain At-9b) TaxID=592316 RepID=UPI0001B3E858|nr:hypothetical protein [Pantoea sp. At-9b]ADU71594.1 hypothetical protein Pat9b_5437 [Pantoea sp. At-9b]